MEKAIDTLLQRRSIASLPLPYQQVELEIIFQSALTAPDHQGLTPWRFITVAQENKEKLAECYIRAQMIEGVIVDEGSKRNIRAKLNRAPDIIICIFSPKANAKVPESEQLLSMGAAIQNMIIASSLLGGNAFWATGNIVYTDGFKDALALAPHEQIAGVLYLGKSLNTVSPKLRHAVRDFFRPFSLGA
ncbi:nitroreductase family protein [Pectobacterium aquaticum]|uniref:nitroreductase family protein n=1 Tax=Pectobacterium aquaticum TaxID=2204145 RepID=UPI000E288F1D|nr:nitroreductase [Pectobacterium aquaticum]UEM39392.1 nitroreductase [Pectobacterium aquaticum]